jgi:hypothetical protein
MNSLSQSVRWWLRRLLGLPDEVASGPPDVPDSARVFMVGHCWTCGADWTAGASTAECPECGGGALEIPCPCCRGRCGRKWKKAVMDSNDFATAHWHGRCGLDDS